MTLDHDSLRAEALALTAAWCRIPSVRGDRQALAAQVEAIRSWLIGRLGAEIVAIASPTGGAPVIHARLDVGAAHTVILYNMYDVMPADPLGWSVPPFTGGDVVLDGVGPAFVARGAENNKGPLAGMLCALASLRDAGLLRVNVEILVEGEEESGSAGLRAYLADPDCRVRPARSALFPSFCEYGGGPARIYLGFSGIAKGAISARGGAWGGPQRAIHSSNAPWIANPASRLVEALGLFGTAPTGALGHIALDAEAAAIVDTLAETFDPAAELRFRHTQTFSLAGTPRALLTHVLTTASGSLSSLSTEPSDADGVIPQAAHARFELRAPPGLDPGALLGAYRTRLDRARLDGIEITLDDCYAGHRFGGTADGVAALAEAYRDAPLPPQTWPWAIGAAPAYAFAPHADSFLLAGLGRGGNAHGIDEFLALDGYGRFLLSLTRWLGAMAD
ncbi:M20 family metallopeptidase [Aureimonas glaciei]|uniref:Peptidase M20 n=1 Tax=Aureimonas glaciei TaxID=1776957 RepID=A0A916XY94_9HYPH|nr:M20/M25/M40 family metallo-hydrolase [Aureimonas glaciei]GGD21768.1 hypothetical protein GCM10011335_25890 [Aureimonas glaciei]